MFINLYYYSMDILSRIFFIGIEYKEKNIQKADSPGKSIFHDIVFDLSIINKSPEME